MEKVRNSLVYVFLIGFLSKDAEGFTQAQKGAVQSKLMSTGMKCIKEYPLTLNDIKSFSTKVIPDGENAKCFAACMFKNVGFMDDMGKLTPAGAGENAKNVFKSDEESLKKANEIIDKCAADVNEQTTNDGNKGCDRAKLAIECLMGNAPKYGFDF